MKRFANVLLCLCVPMLMFLQGCLDEDVHTIVSPDGSLERTYSFKTSSMNVPSDAYPRPNDSSWTVEWKKPKEAESSYVYTARKTFATGESLNSEYTGPRDTGAIGVAVSLTKRFQWFYSYFEYRESYVMRNKLIHVPVTRFMTNEEIERYVQGESSESLERKVDLWDFTNLYEEFYPALIKEIDRRKNPALSAVVSSKKDELFRALIEADSLEKARKESLRDSAKQKMGDADEVLEFCAKFLGNRDIIAYGPYADSVISDIASRQKPGGHPQNWNSSVQMPGILLETNSASVEGNKVSWKFNEKQIHVGEYVMTASSRITNAWAYVVTGIAGLLVAAMMIVGMLRRKKL